MRRFFLSATVLFLVSGASALAQAQYSVSNYMRYGNGEQISKPFEFIENQLNARLFWDDFTIGFEYIYDNPPEFGPRYNGIRKRYVEWAKHGLELRAGDFYTLYGKGLVMNLFEDRGLKYDTRLDGVRGTYRNDWATGIFSLGKMRYNDLLNSERIEVYDVTSGHVELQPFSFMRFGGSMAGITGELPTSFGMDLVKSEMPEAMLSLRGYGFDAFAQYAWKNSNVSRPQADGTFNNMTSTGNAFYGALSYTSDIGLGVTFDYKDYRYDVVGEELRDRNRPTRMLPMANPPIVHKEHYFTLLSRNPHVVDFNDEIGMQLDLFYALSPSVTVNLNGSMASRHEGFITTNGLRVKYERESSLLPSMDEQFSPFYEGYAEVEWYYNDDSYLRIAFNHRYDAPYEFNDSHVLSSTTFPIRVEQVLSDEYSVGVNLEQQLFHDSGNKGHEDFYNQFVSLTLARASQWSATLRMEYTTDPNDPSGEQFWRAVEVSYRLGNEHSLSASYGSERGGLICTNGVCRIVQPFDGLRFSLLSQL